MRRALTFACEGATLAGMLHPAAGATGVVIVTGGMQTRIGAHRGEHDEAGEHHHRNGYQGRDECGAETSAAAIPRGVLGGFAVDGILLGVIRTC